MQPYFYGNIKFKGKFRPPNIVHDNIVTTKLFLMACLEKAIRVLCRFKPLNEKIKDKVMKCTHNNLIVFCRLNIFDVAVFSLTHIGRYPYVEVAGLDQQSI